MLEFRARQRHGLALYASYKSSVTQLLTRPQTQVIYVMASGMSDHFNGLTEEARSVDVDTMHSYQYTATSNVSVLHQLRARFAGGEPILALSCDAPGEPGCYDVYYSNELHKDGKRTVHRIDAQPGSDSKVYKRQSHLTTVQNQAQASSGQDIYGEPRAVEVARHVKKTDQYHRRLPLHGPRHRS